MTDGAEYSVKKNVFLGVCVCLSAAVTLAVNINAIFYLLVFKRGSFSRQPYNNLLMGLQAIMGACLSVLGYTWTAAALLTGSWPAAGAGCSVATFCLLFFGTMDVLITLLMSVERLVALRFPYRYKELISYERILVALAYLFLHGAALSGLPIFLGTVELTKEPVALCLYSIASSRVEERVVVHAFVLNFSACLLVMLACNVVVLRALRHMQGSVSATRHLDDSRDRESMIFSKMTGMMACAYLFCWLPVVVSVGRMMNTRKPRKCTMLCHVVTSI